MIRLKSTGKKNALTKVQQELLRDGNCTLLYCRSVFLMLLHFVANTDFRCNEKYMPLSDAVINCSFPSLFLSPLEY